MFDVSELEIRAPCRHSQLTARRFQTCRVHHNPRFRLVDGLRSIRGGVEEYWGSNICTEKSDAAGDLSKLN